MRLVCKISCPEASSQATTISSAELEKVCNLLRGETYGMIATLER
jgi:hypothetical protein